MDAALHIGDGPLEFVDAILYSCAELGFRCVTHLTFEMTHELRMISMMKNRVNSAVGARKARSVGFMTWGIGGVCALGVVLAVLRDIRYAG